MEENVASECSLVNLTASSTTNWILDLILGQQNTEINTGKYQLDLCTKYYKAKVEIRHYHYADIIKTEAAAAGKLNSDSHLPSTKDGISGQHVHNKPSGEISTSEQSSADGQDDGHNFEKTEALLMYCEGTRISLAKADKMWALVKEHNPAVCLFIVDATKDSVENEDDVTRTDIMSWCLTNNFELIECDEVDDSEPGGICDIVGKDRILEALKSHTWSTMELLDSPAGGPEKKIGEGGHGKPELEESVDSFEALFAELASIKAKAESLPPEERKNYAEKIALSFYAAMGGSDDED